MADLKSAREIAMEKIEKLGETTEDERLKWKYVPEGEQLAAKYLKDDCNLIVELGQYQENVRKYIADGATEILIRRIGLPKNDAIKKSNKRAMDGLKILKSDKINVENIYSRIRALFNHYDEQGEQQRQQAYQSLKTEFESSVQQATEQQLGSLVGTNVDVEIQPQFQQEWHRVQTQLDSQYLTLLGDYQRELSATA